MAGELDPSVSCESCLGSCCHDKRLPLRQREVDFLEEAGTVLSLVAEFEMPAYIEMDGGMYRMVGDCGYLDRDTDFPTCRAHDDESRPNICQTFPAGNSACITFRAMDGIEVRIR